MFKKILAIVIASMLVASVAYAADNEETTVATEKIAGTDMYKTTFTWLADDTDADIEAKASPVIDGWVLLVVSDQGDVTTCVDNMDITLLDSDNVDVIGGGMVDLDAGTTDKKQMAPTLGSAYGARPVIGKVTFTAIECGTNEATGELHVYWVR